MADYSRLVEIQQELNEEINRLLDEETVSITKNNAPELTTEEIVANTILNIGISPRLNGYHYLTRAIMITLSDKNFIHKVTKTLYPVIALELNTMPSKVERSIRHAIDKAYGRGVDNVNMRLGCTNKNKLTNTEFILAITDKIILEGR